MKKIIRLLSVGSNLMWFWYKVYVNTVQFIHAALFIRCSLIMRLVLPSENFEFSPTYKFNIFFLDEAMNLYEQFYANFQSIKLSWILNIPFSFLFHSSDLVSTVQSICLLLPKLSTKYMWKWPNKRYISLEMLWKARWTTAKRDARIEAINNLIRMDDVRLRRRWNSGAKNHVTKKQSIFNRHQFDRMKPVYSFHSLNSFCRRYFVVIYIPVWLQACNSFVSNAIQVGFSSVRIRASSN